ncbi:MAG: DNA adenine methylase [Peptococcaceae bacterium]|nr:MAG: DNA adenine methylase [Peptococcaceae bacterium]
MVEAAGKSHCIVRPPVKWAGGKSRLLPQLKPLFPDKVDCLAEPFVGGGAVFFHLRPPGAVLMDNNPELINFYLVLRDEPDLLLTDLKKHRNEGRYYYRLRSVNPVTLTAVQRASRFLYLNKTAYNGLWRVNSRGLHNVPYGHYKNPRILDEENLRQVHLLLKNVTIMLADFGRVLEIATPGMFIYIDPPYHPLSKTAGFTGYTAGSFGEGDQRRLAGVFRELDRRGCRLMLSNSDTPLIRELYGDYEIKVVTARRAINCRPDRRGPVTELVIRNYDV